MEAGFPLYGQGKFNGRDMGGMGHRKRRADLLHTFAETGMLIQ